MLHSVTAKQVVVLPAHGFEAGINGLEHAKVKEMHGKNTKLSLIAISLMSLMALGFVARWGMTRYSTIALIEEMKEPNLDRVKHWLDLGADANARDDDGVPILLLAVSSNDSDVLLSLIERGADINALVPPHGYTALMIASAKANLTIVRLLLDKGAKANIRSGPASGDRTALTMVRNTLKVPLLNPGQKKNYKQTEQILLKAGATL
jgi:hypothetical protein